MVDYVLWKREVAGSGPAYPTMSNMSGFHSFMAVWLKTIPDAAKWSVEKTTQNDNKIKWDRSKYRMFIFSKDNELIRESDEFPGTNKNYWSGSEYAHFLVTLKDPRVM